MRRRSNNKKGRARTAATNNEKFTIKTNKRHGESDRKPRVVSGKNSRVDSIMGNGVTKTNGKRFDSVLSITTGAKTTRRKHRAKTTSGTQTLRKKQQAAHNGDGWKADIVSQT